MTKLNEGQIEKLEALEIEGITDEAVRPQILKMLWDKHELDGMGDDSIDDLIDILEQLDETESKKGKKEAKKEEKPKVKNAKVEKEEEAEEEEEEEEEEKPIKKKEEVKKSKPEVKQKVAPKEEEEEAEQETPKKVDSKPAKDKKEKKDKGEKSPKISYNGDEKDHVAKMEIVLKQLKKEGLKLNFNKSCIPATLNSSDSNRSIITVESIGFKGDEVSMKVVFNGFNLFRANSDLKELMEKYLDEDFHDRIVVNNNRSPFVKAVTEAELKKVCNEEVMKLIIDKIQSLDKRLRKGREKMEENFEKENAKEEEKAKVKDKVKK